MKVGILIAVEQELKAFLSQGSEITEEEVSRRRVYHTVLGGHELYALCSGYGEIDAAAGTQLLITRYGCEAVLNFGVAGALTRDLQVEDLFLVRKVCHYDFDISPIDPVEKHQYLDLPDRFIPVDERLLTLAKEVLPEFREIAVASGDRFVEEPEDKRWLAALGCGICDMEIAAIARTCFLNGVPCLSVKCISDTFDGTGADYAANVEKGARKAFAALRKILEQMKPLR